MNQLSLPIRSLIRENTATILTYAFSRVPLKQLYEGGFAGDWKTLESTLFELTRQRAERACLELALLLRYLDDEEQFGEYIKVRTNFTFGRLQFRSGESSDLQLRDVSNKIIHASSLDWSSSSVSKQPVLVCRSRDEEKWIHAEVELVNFAAVCGNLADAHAA